MADVIRVRMGPIIQVRMASKDPVIAGSASRLALRAMPCNSGVTVIGDFLVAVVLDFGSAEGADSIFMAAIRSGNELIITLNRRELTLDESPKRKDPGKPGP